MLSGFKNSEPSLGISLASSAWCCFTKCTSQNLIMLHNIWAVCHPLQWRNTPSSSPGLCLLYKQRFRNPPSSSCAECEGCLETRRGSESHNLTLCLPRKSDSMYLPPEHKQSVMKWLKINKIKSNLDVLVVFFRLCLPFSFYAKHGYFWLRWTLNTWRWVWK